MPRVVVDVWDVDPDWRPPPELIAQLQLVHQVREELVRLHLRYEAELTAFWSSFPRVAVAERALAVAEATASDTPAGVASVGEARRARSDAIEALADKTAVKRAEWALTLKTRQKELYSQYCQRNDLYWVTFNDVFLRYQEAVAWIRQRRRAGACVALKHRPFNGEGTVAVQLRHRPGWPAPIPAVVADPTSKYGSVAVLPWTDPTHETSSAPSGGRQAGGCQTARLRCGQYNGLPAWLTLPVKRCHRLPAHAEITNVSLSVRQSSEGLRGQLSVTANISDNGFTNPTAPAVALLAADWTRVQKQSWQVAQWRSTSPLDIPHELQASMTVDSSISGRIMLTGSLSSIRDRARIIRAQRATALDAIRGALVNWLDQHGSFPYPGADEHHDELSAESVNLWRTPRQFAALTEAWDALSPPQGQDIVRRLVQWQRSDSRRWATEYSLRSRSMRSRESLFQSVANLLAQHAEVVVVDRPAKPSAADVATSLIEDVDHEWLVTGPDRLSQLTVDTALRRDRQLIVTDPIALPRTHTLHLCAHLNPNDQHYSTLRALCPGCHH